jgi:cytochrome c oxidase subunit 2
VLGELHVPVNRPVIIELSSKDVIHNFCLPHMRVAQDAIPGQIIPMWFKPIKTGTYEVVCGQLCGLGHYSMKGALVVDTPEDYQAWLKERVELSGNQSAPPGAPKNTNPTGAPTPNALPLGAPTTASPSGG